MRQDINAGMDDGCQRCRVPAADGEALLRRLRLAGHLVTVAREAVVRAAAAQTRPFTAGELCAAVAARAPAVGRATVFRTLDLLVSEGLVDRLYSRGAHVSYLVRASVDEAGGGRPRQYLVCALCDGVAEIADDHLVAALEAAAARHAFRADGALVEILGRCPAC